MSDNENPKNWYVTLPGILSGAAAVIAALGAFISTWHSLNDTSNHNPDKTNIVGFAGFHCSVAQTNVEKLVCSVPTLGELDKEMNNLFRKLKTQLKENEQQILINEQRKWIEERDRCQNTHIQLECVGDTYKTRVLALKMQLKEINNLISKQPDNDISPIKQESAGMIKATNDCERKPNYIEQSICSNPELASLDVKMETLYKSSLKTSPVFLRAKLRRQQTQWLHKRDNCAGKENFLDCLKQEYESRISAFPQK